MDFYKIQSIFFLMTSALGAMLEMGIILTVHKYLQVFFLVFCFSQIYFHLEVFGTEKTDIFFLLMYSCCTMLYVTVICMIY